MQLYPKLFQLVPGHLLMGRLVDHRIHEVAGCRKRQLLGRDDLVPQLVPRPRDRLMGVDQYRAVTIRPMIPSIEAQANESAMLHVRGIREHPPLEIAKGLVHGGGEAFDFWVCRNLRECGVRHPLRRVHELPLRLADRLGPRERPCELPFKPLTLFR